MTSTSGCSSAIFSPSLTSHFRISPSAIPSPISGNFSSNKLTDPLSLVDCRLSYRPKYPFRRREIHVLERIGEGRVEPSKPDYRSPERVDRTLSDLGGEFSDKTRDLRGLMS